VKAFGKDLHLSLSVNLGLFSDSKRLPTETERNWRKLRQEKNFTCFLTYRVSARERKRGEELVVVSSFFSFICIYRLE